MVVCDHNIARDTLSYDVALGIFDYEDYFKPLLFFVVATVTCDPGRKGTCAGREVNDFRAIKNDDFLVFVCREWR